ncbi:transcriptional regulator, LysR family [Methanocaldococcus infernus ME]|uniref:Transcriptional regulator, LysR family n=1 Tax=Methanocaldococcus infernus (strain DSM 11812 / JCM 15783 / ME) TaxID=573063 RepID=D5VT78_METIM|nr:selenium metabolism-associated LysR family transcriptional regulator [Methanocaldococcus infernus]ADG13781.1 transcriptional regulator, LysR family [Methanocaldococcus infernus ME]
MDPKLKYFKTFLVASETKSFSKAAKILGITQGTVSNHIATLEKYFDAQLFVRTPEGVELTPEGKILYEKAKAILDMVEEAKILMKSLSEVPEGTIRLYASTIPGEYILPSIIKEFKEKYPSVDFDVNILDTERCYKALEEGLADVISVGYLKSKDYDYIIIGKDRLVLIVPPNHPFAKRKSVKFEEILNEDYIDREEGSGTKKTIEEALNKKGYSMMDLNVTMRLGSTSSVITAVSEGYGISIISEIPAKKAESAGLVRIVPIEDLDITRYLYLIKSRRPKNPSAVKTFWEFLKKI